MEDKAERDHCFELTDEEKKKFKRFLELHGCAIDKLNSELNGVAEQLHHIAFKYLMLMNELTTEDERIERRKTTEELFKSKGKTNVR